MPVGNTGVEEKKGMVVNVVKDSTKLTRKVSSEHSKRDLDSSVKGIFGA